MLQQRVLARGSSRVLVALLSCSVVPKLAIALPMDGSATSEMAGGSTSYVEIQWQAPSECPDSASVRAHTERLLGQPLHAAFNQRVIARARVRRNDAGNWELSLSLASNDRVAEETLVAKQCSALADATALKVALAIDPLATARAIEASAQVSEMRPPALPPSAPNPEVPPPGASLLEGGVRLDLGGGLGLLPGFAWGGNLGLWLQRGAWRAELSGHALAGESARYAEMPTVGARLQLFSALLRACHSWNVGRLELPVCLGVDVGLSRGVGFGLETTSAATSWWGAVVLGPALRLPVSERVAFWLEADAVVPYVRSGFKVRNLGTLYTARPVGTAAWAGLEIRLSR